MSQIRDMLAETGISEQQWRVLRVLRVLSELGPMDTSLLAEQASLLFFSLTRIAMKMSPKGLLTQTRDTKDRRRQIVEITAAGQKIIDYKVDEAAQIVVDLKPTMGEDKYEQLLDLLALLDPSPIDQR
ncbi:MAG: MarR family transcriptional regulator [Rhizobiaceae bacterium]